MKPSPVCPDFRSSPTTLHLGVRAFVLGTLTAFSFAAALPQPIAYWNFEDGSGSVLHDQSGNGHNGTIVGTAAWMADGVSGSSLHFNGSTYVDIPASSAFSPLGAFTLSAWVWQDTENLDRPVMEFSQPVNYSGVQVWVNTPGSGTVVPGDVDANLRFLSPQSSNQFVVPSGYNPTGKWNHIVLTFDSSTHLGILYINGTERSSLSVPSAQLPSTAGDFYLGYRPTTSLDSRAGATFLGRMDEVRMYSSALDSLQVDSLYSATLTSPPLNLSYRMNSATYAVGVAITPDTPSVSGSPPFTYSVSPALPSNLTLNATTGIISGTPATVTAAANYKVTVTNSYGSDTVSLNISALTAPSGLSYATNPAAYYVGTAIAPNTPSVTGTVTSYSVSPALPAGLTFNITTGAISGTPTATALAANYTVKAFNGLVFTSVSVNITVVAPPTGLSYSANPATYGMGVAITPNNPTVSGTAPITYSVNPALPAGMVLNATTGVISGTPTQSAPAASYTITASSAYGSTVATVNLTVIPPPANLSYLLSPAYYLVNTLITPNTPTVTGTVSSYSINPALPTGLTLNTATGVISGTPVLHVSNNFTITASNIAGSTTVVVNLTVSLPLSNLSYSSNPASYFVGSAIATNNPSITGSAPIAYSVNPALPAGLSLNTSTGVISGTPTAFAATANYTITASNPSSGITTAVLTLAVNSAISVLQLNGSQSFTVMVSQSPAVKFELPTGNAQRAIVEILDMNGTRVWEGSADLKASENSLTWNGSANGRAVSGGVYFARMTLWDGNQKEINAINKKFVYLP